MPKQAEKYRNLSAFVHNFERISPQQDSRRYISIGLENTKIPSKTWQSII